MLCFIDNYKVFLQHYLSGYYFFTKKSYASNTDLFIMKQNFYFIFQRWYL